MKNTKPIDTPIATATRLDMDKYEKHEDKKKYRGNIALSYI